MKIIYEEKAIKPTFEELSDRVFLTKYNDSVDNRYNIVCVCNFQLGRHSQGVVFIPDSVPGRYAGGITYSSFEHFINNYTIIEEIKEIKV